jgi:two-component system alkaline phosphatase synthesis response regulator PhoP
MGDKKTKVLLVEDDQMILDMYKTRLVADGYEVFTTDKGSEAMSLAKSKKPNIVLLDVILPEVDGFSILKDLKADSETKSIPVLMLTNLGQESDQSKGKDIGAQGYFVKAQHIPADIISKIEELIKQTNK